jgi:hypothetical protein
VRSKRLAGRHLVNYAKWQHGADPKANSFQTTSVWRTGDLVNKRIRSLPTSNGLRPSATCYVAINPFLAVAASGGLPAAAPQSVFSILSFSALFVPKVGAPNIFRIDPSPRSQLSARYNDASSAVKQRKAITSVSPSIQLLYEWREWNAERSHLGEKRLKPIV